MQRLLTQVRNRQAPGAARRSARGATQAERRYGVDLFRLDQRRRWTRRSRALDERGIHLDALRIRGFPLQRRGRRLHRRATTRSSWSSRTATRQLRILLVNECDVDPARLVPVLHYDGTPITARFIIEAIAER